SCGSECAPEPDCWGCCLVQCAPSICAGWCGGS
uniref:Pheromone Ep-1 n=2 Tax=Euplotes petzi TaxID=1156992 RepID=A0A182DV16_9SPIT|nr:Chain A, pheromone Ep-1 [Euplotes petzi]